jgi:cell division septum initiation protein DivIVA
VSQPSYEFRTVMRGFEPTEVERALQQLWTKVEENKATATEALADNDGLRRQLSALSDQSRIDQVQIRQLQEELTKLEAPSASAITERAAKILKLAEEEADEILTKAKTQAVNTEADADAYAEKTRKASDLQAAETSDKAVAEGARVIEDANQKADEILDTASREATTRREEAEAIFERQRARAAAAAADFEKTLAVRRDEAATDFGNQMSAYEQALTAAEQRHSAMRAESDRMLAEAKQDAQAMLRAAREDAAQKLDDSRLAAERVRKESERELLAATARREAVTAQLTNVRQMIAALGAGPLLDVMGEDDDEPSGIVPASVKQAEAESAAAIAAASADSANDDISDTSILDLAEFEDQVPVS